LLEPYFLGCEERLEAELDATTGRLDPVVALRVKEWDEPISNPQASAANLQDPGF